MIISSESLSTEGERVAYDLDVGYKNYVIVLSEVLSLTSC